VISLISKPQDFPDGSVRLAANGPRVHEFLQEMQRAVLSKYDIMTVGEAACVTLEEAVHYANTDCTELNMVFQFEHMELDGNEQSSKWNDSKIDLVALKTVLARWQNGLFGRAWNSLYWCNHDQPRIVSRLGDTGEFREKSAKMLATCLHFMQGTPYIYQGEELGMTNAPFSSFGDYRDIESINAYNKLVVQEKSVTKTDMLRYLGNRSRDNARTPMHWNSSTNAGFSAAEPWIMLNPNYCKINAEEQIHHNADSVTGSVFAYYQRLIQLRKEMGIITFGNFKLLLPDDPDLFVYTRCYEKEELLVICNFSGKERSFELPEYFFDAKVLIANEEISVLGNTITVGAFGAVVCRI
jgi:oligo-1,6-glucosidase